MGARLTRRFGGAQVGQDALLEAVGGGTVTPFIKQGGEDDIFLVEGPRGHIQVMWDPDQGLTTIVNVVPYRDGETDKLAAALERSAPKFVIIDRVTGDQYETRDRREAELFGRALGSDGESRVLTPDEPDFDRERKPVPETIFA